jgi:hypothetical protein
MASVAGRLAASKNPRALDLGTRNRYFRSSLALSPDGTLVAHEMGRDLEGN